MTADGMAVRQRAPHQRRELLRRLAQHEECRGRTGLAKHVENFRRGVRVGTVIEGEHDLALAQPQRSIARSVAADILARRQLDRAMACATGEGCAREQRRNSHTCRNPKR